MQENRTRQDKYSVNDNGEKRKCFQIRLHTSTIAKYKYLTDALGYGRDTSYLIEESLLKNLPLLKKRKTKSETLVASGKKVTFPIRAFPEIMSQVKVIAAVNGYKNTSTLIEECMFRQMGSFEKRISMD